MALIKCPKCGKEQSNFAKICVNCSFPLEEYALDPDGFSWGKQEAEDFKACTEVDEIEEIQFDEEQIHVDEEKITNVGYVDNNAEPIYVHKEDKIEKQFINMGIIHRVIDWFLAVLIIVFSLLPLIGGSPICGLFWLISGIMTLPINGILSKWDLVIKGKCGWLRTVIIIVVNFAGYFAI